MKEAVKEPEVIKEETETSVEKKSGLKPKTKVYLFIAGFLGLLIVLTIIAILYTLLYVKNNGTQILINTDNSSVPTITLTPTTDLSEYGLFYTKSDGVYEYNLHSQAAVKIMDAPNSNESLFYAGDNKLIVVKGSDSVPGYSAYVIDLNTKVSALIKTFTNTSTVQYYFQNFYNASDYLVLKYTQTDTGIAENLINVRNNIQTDLGIVGYNRQSGGSYTSDSYRIIPSPDGSHIVFRTILVGESFGDAIPNIFIINKDTNAIQTINNGKMPLWIDNTHVLYQSLADNQLYSYNIADGSTSAYASFTLNMSDKYGLHMNGNNLLYWKSDNAVYLYNIATSTETKLLTDATDARWYDSNTIIFSKVLASDTNINGISSQNLWMYKVSDGTETKIVDDQMLGDYALKTDRGVYFCEAVTCSD